MNHDPLCSAALHPLTYTHCDCDLIEQVGERIAQAIEAGIKEAKFANKYTIFAKQDDARIARRNGV